jgi:hypothetical protein
MSKNAVTLHDLTEALKPLMNAIIKISEDQGFANTQISELYNMTTNVSTKLDLFDQRGYSDEPIKKTTSKKSVSKKAPLKETADTVSTADETDTEEKKDIVKKPVAKKNIKKTSETNNQESTTNEAVTDDSKKAPVKKAQVKKTSKTPIKKERPINKMEFFSKMYDMDETFFDTYLTPKVRKEIAAENAAAWDEVEGESLNKLKRNAYYSFMRDNFDDKLQSMKNAYLEEHNTQKVDLVEKDDASE